MSVIDNDVVVKIGGGEIYFEDPPLNVWAIITGFATKEFDEQADIVVSKITDVKGLEYKDGEAVTLESLKNKKFGLPFFIQLRDLWAKAVIASSAAEASTKNEPTPASSSSSEAGSSSPT